MRLGLGLHFDSQRSAGSSHEFSPLDLSPAFWMDASEGAYTDAGSTLAADGESVQQWNDQSGNGRNVEQLTASIKPTYKTGIINGEPVLRFDGGDYLQGTWNESDTPFHLFIVSQVSNTSQSQFSAYFASYGISPPAKSFQVDFGASGEWRSLNTANDGIAFAEPEIGTPVSDAVIMEVAGDASGIRTYLNGTAGETASDPTNGTFGNFAIGRNRGVTNFITGDIAEVIAYAEALSGSDAADVRSYLASKYNITI